MSILKKQGVMQTEKEKLESVKQNGYSIRYINNPSDLILTYQYEDDNE